MWTGEDDVAQAHDSAGASARLRSATPRVLKY